MPKMVDTKLDNLFLSLGINFNGELSDYSITLNPVFVLLSLNLAGTGLINHGSLIEITSNFKADMAKRGS